ncbi:hypothetical protein ACFX19_037574 [Malus domestica]
MTAQTLPPWPKYSNPTALASNIISLNFSNPLPRTPHVLTPLAEAQLKRPTGWFYVMVMSLPAFAESVAVTNVEATQRCPDGKEVIIWYDECMVVATSVHELTTAAANKGSNETVYSLAQCTQALSASDFKRCLAKAAEELVSMVSQVRSIGQPHSVLPRQRLFLLLSTPTHPRLHPPSNPHLPFTLRFLSTALCGPTRPKPVNIGARARQLQTRRLWTYALTFSCIVEFVCHRPQHLPRPARPEQQPDIMWVGPKVRQFWVGLETSLGLVPGNPVGWRDFPRCRAIFLAVCGPIPPPVEVL